MVMWVCEAWQVNIFAVRPNGANKKNKKNFASSRSDRPGSDKNEERLMGNGPLYRSVDL